MTPDRWMIGALTGCLAICLPLFVVVGLTGMSTVPATALAAVGANFGIWAGGTIWIRASERR